MKIYTFRIKPGNDLKSELETFVKAKNIQAGFVITCVGASAKLQCAWLARYQTSKTSAPTKAI